MSRRNAQPVPFKYWLWTLNNPTDEHVPANVWEDVEYAIWQHERGEDGTDHIQGYVCFKKAKRITWLKEHCDERAHWEPRAPNSDHDSAKNYCSKADTRVDGPWTVGDDKNIPRKKGERMDLKRVHALMTAGATAADLMINPDTFPVWCRNYRAIDRFLLETEPKRNQVTFTQVYWGTSGAGKTRRAYYEASLKADGTPGEPYYVLRKPQGNAVYWDGYKGEKNLIIDEFYGWIPRSQMLTLCDRYPCIIDFKGGARNCLVTKIWITSNDPPEQWWNRVGLGPMVRRLAPAVLDEQGRVLVEATGSIVHMTQPWAPPGEVPAPLPMVVPPIFSPPEVGAVIVPLIDQMVRQAQDEAQEAAAYARLEQEEEDQALARWFEMQEN